MQGARGAARWRRDSTRAARPRPRRLRFGVVSPGSTVMLVAPGFTGRLLCSSTRRHPAAEVEGWGVSTDVVEAGCRTIVGTRLERSGMYWTVEDANAILALRCAILVHPLRRVPGNAEQLALSRSSHESDVHPMALPREGKTAGSDHAGHERLSDFSRYSASSASRGDSASGSMASSALHYLRAFLRRRGRRRGVRRGAEQRELRGRRLGEARAGVGLERMEDRPRPGDDRVRDPRQRRHREGRSCGPAGPSFTRCMKTIRSPCSTASRWTLATPPACWASSVNSK